MLAVMVVGCKKVTKSDTVTLVVWGDPDNQVILEACFAELNSAFAAKNPGIKLDYQWSGSFDGINVAMQANALPDMFWVQGNKSSRMAEMAKAGFLLQLDRFNPDPSMYPASAVDYALVDGKTYCSYPGFIDYALIYYNVNVFNANGLSKPATYNDFVNAMQKLYANGVTPFALGGDFEWSRYWPLQIMCSSLASGDLRRIQGGQTTGNFPEITFVFNQFREFCDKGYFGNPPGAMDESSAQLAFSNGRAAMIAEGTWNNSLFSNLSFEVGRFALPDNNGLRYAQSGYSNFTTYAVSSKCQHPDEAWKYLEFLNSIEAQQITHNHMKSIPALDRIVVTDPVVAQVSDFQRVGENIYHVLSNVPTRSGKPQDVFLSSTIADLMIGRVSGERGMQTIIDEMNK
jgi:raffinose/stachyose/melibiose transport system substrate-binding protein